MMGEEYESATIRIYFCCVLLNHSKVQRISCYHLMRFADKELSFGLGITVQAFVLNPGPGADEDSQGGDARYGLQVITVYQIEMSNCHYSQTAEVLAAGPSTDGATFCASHYLYLLFIFHREIIFIIFFWGKGKFIR